MNGPEKKMAGAASLPADAPTNDQDRSPDVVNSTTQATSTTNQKLCYSVEELCQVWGISLSTAYQYLKDGTIPSIRIFKRKYLIPCRAVDDLLAKATEGAHAG